MGNWYLDENERWQYDEDAPSPEARTWTPVVTSEHPSLFEKPSGEVYGRVDPEQFALFDDVDSAAIRDDGGPLDAA